MGDVGIVSLISSNMLCASVRVVAAVLFISLTIAPLVKLLNLVGWSDLRCFWAFCHFFHFATMSITVLKGRAKTIAITFSSFFPPPNNFILKFHKQLVFLCEVKNDLLFRMANKLMFIVQQLTTIEYGLDDKGRQVYLMHNA